jgi:hypothetical protein
MRYEAGYQSGPLYYSTPLPTSMQVSIHWARPAVLWHSPRDTFMQRSCHAEGASRVYIYNEIGKSCMTVAVKACAQKKDAKSDMK